MNDTEADTPLPSATPDPNTSSPSASQDPSSSPVPMSGGGSSTDAPSASFSPSFSPSEGDDAMMPDGGQGGDVPTQNSGGGGVPDNNEPTSGSAMIVQGWGRLTIYSVLLVVLSACL